MGNGFWYFIPDALPISNWKRFPPETGLSLVCEGLKVQGGETYHPKTKDRGQIVCRVDQPEGAIMDFDRQHWRPSRPYLGDGEYGEVTHYLGWLKDRPPTPRDLARDVLVEGSVVTLRDGNDWIIPHVTFNRPTLPLVHGLDENGRDALVFDQRYDAIVAESEKWLAIITPGDHDRRCNMLDLFGWFANLLSINYRVGRSELAALGLVDNTPGFALSIIQAAFGMDELMKEQQEKKTDAIPCAG